MVSCIERGGCLIKCPISVVVVVVVYLLTSVFALGILMPHRIPVDTERPTADRPVR